MSSTTVSDTFYDAPFMKSFIPVRAITALATVYIRWNKFLITKIQIYRKKII